MLPKPDGSRKRMFSMICRACLSNMVVGFGQQSAFDGEKLAAVRSLSSSEFDNVVLIVEKSCTVEVCGANHRHDSH